MPGAESPNRAGGGGKGGIKKRKRKAPVREKEYRGDGLPKKRGVAQAPPVFATIWVEQY